MDSFGSALGESWEETGLDDFSTRKREHSSFNWVPSKSQTLNVDGEVWNNDRNTCLKSSYIVWHGGNYKKT